MPRAVWAFAAVVGLVAAVIMPQWSAYSDLLISATFFETLYHTYVSTAGQEAFINRTLTQVPLLSCLHHPRPSSLTDLRFVMTCLPLRKPTYMRDFFSAGANRSAVMVGCGPPCAGRWVELQRSSITQMPGGAGFTSLLPEGSSFCSGQ